MNQSGQDRNECMLFFKCRPSLNELVAMEKYLPEETYCITREKFEEYYYGVIRVTMFNKLLNVLSGETLEHLEYLNDDEFRDILSHLKFNNIPFLGNRELLIE